MLVFILRKEKPKTSLFRHKNVIGGIKWGLRRFTALLLNLKSSSYLTPISYAYRSTGILLYCHSNASTLGVVLLRYAIYLSHLVGHMLRNNTLCIDKQNGRCCGISGIRLIHRCLHSRQLLYNSRSSSKLLPVRTVWGKITYRVRPPLNHLIYRYGRSIGCIAACYLAARIHSISGIVLESPISCLRDVVNIPSLFFSVPMKDKIEKLSCVAYLPNVTCLKCLIYGTKDQFSRRRSIKVSLREEECSCE